MTEAFPTTSAWRPPQQFDEYRLVRPLGAGAMGQVFLAHDQVLDRPVAIKFVVSESLADDDARERLILEARAIARLQHPNVVAVFRVSAVDGQPYLVSEFVRGQRLDQIEKPLAWKRVLALGLGLARGLAAAHRRGVLHRDIKLANAIVSEEDGEAKLLDFGLAKLLDRGAPPVLPDAAQPAGSAQSFQAKGVVHLTSSGDGDGHATQVAVNVEPFSQTETGAIMGSPLYLAPELWAQEPASTRSDVYALGVALYYLAAGVPPHTAASIQELGDRVIDHEARPLREVAPPVDAGFAQVIDRCLRRDPRLRFASAEELREALDQLTHDAASAAIPEGNPYRGLSAFHAEHRAIFFGREAETRQILDRLRAEPLILVAADSGVGKSSLCQAGVLPRVASGALGGRTWSVATLVPGRWPAYALANTLASFVGDDPESLLERAKADPEHIGRELRARQGSDRGLLVMVDQLEELSTSSDAEEARVFATAVAAIARLAPGSRILGTVRADFLARIAQLPGLGDDIGRALYVLHPLDPEGIREAIVGPARSKGVLFEPDAVRLLALSAKAEGSLPLLQFALAELWERRNLEKQMIEVSALDASGGVEGALARHADGVIASLLPGARLEARRIMTRLVTAKGTRTRRSESDLALSSPDAQAAIEALVRGRLMSVTEGSDGAAYYDLAHEALIRGWSTLRQWLDDDADRRASRERLARAAAEWERLGRSRDALYRERQLTEWAGLDAGRLPPRDQEFLRASRKAVQRSKQLRIALFAAVPLTALLAFGGVHLKARYDLAASVKSELEKAEAPIAEARAERIELDRLRREAFAAFDAGDRQAGEQAWAKARAVEASLRAVYTAATKTLETAVMFDPSRDDVRERVANLLFERTVSAERDRRISERAELFHRLEAYDREGSYQRALSAPAHLTLVTNPPGARARIMRYEIVDERRTLGTQSDLGSTPLAGTAIAPGSYVVVLDAPGRATVRYPLRLDRDERFKAEMDLPESSEVPSGFVYVPPGRFEFGSSTNEALRAGFLSTVPRHPVESGAYLISRNETTYADWIEFLSALSPAARAGLMPRISRRGFNGTVLLEEVRAGKREKVWQITLQPTIEVHQARAGEKIRYSGRRTREEQDWLKLPVSGISFEDAKAYAAWLDSSGRIPGARLCTEHEWERAARGADDREYPHGGVLAPDDANFDETYGKDPLAFGPDEVGSHPASASPFGVDDLAGNVWEWTTSVLEPGRAIGRGGSYYHDKTAAWSTDREHFTLRDITIGMRVCAGLQRSPKK